jgi:malate dehydrogenase (oxaloacetate-decarboxylating)(NADP+)
MNEDIEEFIQTVRILLLLLEESILKDIKAPESFLIERRLVEELNIPVMHDDQHDFDYHLISCIVIERA